MKPSRLSFRLPLAAVAACAALAGCHDDAELWGDSMSPTQMQQQQMGTVTPNYFATTQGDSDDPFVDNANYPFVQGPWWSNPAYNGG